MFNKLKLLPYSGIQTFQGQEWAKHVETPTIPSLNSPVAGTHKTCFKKNNSIPKKKHVVI